MIGFAEFSRRCNFSALLRYFADIIAYPVERLCPCVSRPPVAALVPRPRVNLIRYFGSFNFDPRSANLNTEMGVIIHDAKLGEFYAPELASHYEEFAYVVFKDEKGKIRWRGYNDGEEVILTKEPNATGWDRIKVGFAGLFPIKSQL